jgi:hypothetical protein
MAPGAVAAAAVRRQRIILEAFARVGATYPEGAKSLDEVGVDPDDRFVRRLQNADVIREGIPGRFYFDVERWHARRQSRVLIVLALALIVAALALAVGVFSNKR